VCVCQQLRIFAWLHTRIIFMPPQAMRSGGYAIMFHYVALSRCPAPTSPFLSLRANTEQISMKFVGGNHYLQQQMNWLHFGQNCTKNNASGYNRKSESTSNGYSHVASVEASCDPARPLLNLYGQCFLFSWKSRRLQTQVALLSQRGRAMLRVCQ